MKKKYIKLTRTTTYSGHTLQVQQQIGNLPLCNGCFFTRNNLAKCGLKQIQCHKHNLACTPYTRKDKCNVIFVEISRVKAKQSTTVLPIERAEQIAMTAGKDRHTERKAGKMEQPAAD